MLMENVVFLAVLFAAACHAGWNALIKVGLDPLSTTTLISIGSAHRSVGTCSVRGSSGVGCLAVARRIGCNSPHLFRFVDRKLSHRRSRPGLSDRSRLRAADDGRRDDRHRRRKIEPGRVDWHPCLGCRGSFAVCTWRTRSCRRRSSCHWFCALHGNYSLRLLSC